MFEMIATLGMLAVAANRAPAATTPWRSSNDPLVSYQWSIDPGARPDCDLRVMDIGTSQQKRVSISYRTRTGSRIELIVRMNPGDPHERIIGGCKAIDAVQIVQR